MMKYMQVIINCKNETNESGYTMLLLSACIYIYIYIYIYIKEKTTTKK